MNDWTSKSKNFPVLFSAHGSPMLTLSENKYSLGWQEIGKQLYQSNKPKAIVCISAHWLTPGTTQVTASEFPKTIHDFGPMDDRLFQIQYTAPGAPELAKYISDKVKDIPIRLDEEWGYDHGSWCILQHMFPKADIPLIQLSIDYGKDMQYHFELAQQLQFLRREGVFIVCSGNVVHNLRLINRDDKVGYDWAVQFDQEIKKYIQENNIQGLLEYEKLGEPAHLSVPTPDHYIPLIYAMGLRDEDDKVSYPSEGIENGAISMRSVLFSS